MNPQKERIWELDAFRGLCLLGMIAVHLVFDLTHFGGLELNLPGWFYSVKKYGHLFFVLLSGICVTLASSSFRRGLAVFAAGLLISYVTLFLDLILGLENLRIWFGILHMLGICMMLYPLFRRLPLWALAAAGVCFIGLGLWFETQTVSVPFLFPLGLCAEDVFVGSDYFPLLPGFGWFLLGAFLGKTVYRKQKSLFPGRIRETKLVRFLQNCGTHSLLIYLLHQPILVLLTLILC